MAIIEKIGSISTNSLGRLKSSSPMQILQRFLENNPIVAKSLGISMDGCPHGKPMGLCSSCMGGGGGAAKGGQRAGEMSWDECYSMWQWIKARMAQLEAQRRRLYQKFRPPVQPAANQPLPPALNFGLWLRRSFIYQPFSRGVQRFNTFVNRFAQRMFRLAKLPFRPVVHLMNRFERLLYVQMGVLHRLASILGGNFLFRQAQRERHDREAETSRYVSRFRRSHLFQVDRSVN